MITSLPLTMQKNDLPIPSLPLALISKSPLPKALVYGAPRAGPNSSIISVICKKFANIPAGNDSVSVSTYLIVK